MKSSTRGTERVSTSPPEDVETLFLRGNFPEHSSHHLGFQNQSDNFRECVIIKAQPQGDVMFMIAAAAMVIGVILLIENLS